MQGKYRVIEFRPGANTFRHFRGLSTYPKPTLDDYPNLGFGSELIEIDTGNIFIYDSDNDVWLEL